MRLVELVRRQSVVTESTPVPPQEAIPFAIQDSLTRVERLKTADPEIRAALDAALRALRHALALAQARI